MEKRISDSVINRLPRYYRYLTDLIENGTERISSRELSEKMNITASQIRQDLNCFGGFGQQGYGYNVNLLRDEIAKILGIDQGYTAILIGAGHMGRTFATNTKFETRGFRLIGIFDSDPKKVGQEVAHHTIRDYSTIQDFIQENQPKMAILTVPKDAMHRVAEEMIQYGIRAFLNFSYTELSDNDDDIVVENVHLSDSLMRLSYKLSKKDKETEK